MNRRNSVAWGFLGLIAVGAGLLVCPFARNAGTYGNVYDALFTACSAVCVTGLTVVDIAAEYSRAGQWVLITLVELGCLGLMTFGTFIMIAIGRRLSISREFSLMNAYGVEQVQGLRGLIFWVIGSMIVIEGAGTLALFWHLNDWYLSFFLTVMSFCNAGFSVLPSSLSSFAADPYVLGVLALETILGGIGFLVIYNLCTFWYRKRGTGSRGRLSLHASIVLRFTIYLLLAAFGMFLLLEWNGALSGFEPLQKLYVGFYQAVTPRTCGFSVVPTETLKPLTRLVYEVLMFIGGAPGSAAAGIKVTTFAVLLYTLRALCRGDQETIISRHAITFDTVRESLVIFVALVMLVILTIAALMVTEEGNGSVDMGSLFFEAVSAITTTGLSCGDVSSRMTPYGRAVIMVAMFLGRLGALTVVMMIGEREVVRHIRYPSGELVVG